MLIDNKKVNDYNEKGFNPNVQNQNIPASYTKSSLFGYVCIGIITFGLFPLFYSIKKRNWFNRIEMKINNMVSNLDIQYEQRLETLTNVFNLTKKYLTHEKELMVEVTNARNIHNTNKDATHIVNSTNKVESALSRLLVVVEKYPEIKADRIINDAFQSVDYQAREVMAVRRMYNTCVNEFNSALFVWPSKIIAAKLHLEMKPLFVGSQMARISPVFNDK